MFSKHGMYEETHKTDKHTMFPYKKIIGALRNVVMNNEKIKISST